MSKNHLSKSIFWGIVAGLAMAGFYLIIMFLTMSSREVWESFSEFWFLILGIIAGFGIQIGLWIYVKNGGMRKHSAAMPGVSGATSGTAMIACCAHHLADVLPVLGLSGASIVLTQYQKPFLVLGLSINLFGIAYMMYILRKQKNMMSMHFEQNRKEVGV